MKIFMVDNARGWGGAEEQFLAMAKGLTAAGHSVTLAVREKSACSQRLSGEAFNVWPVPRGGLRGVAAMARFAAAARREQFEMVHVHRDHDLPVGKLYALVTGAPLILTQHCQPSKPSQLMYCLADKIACVSEYIASGIRTRLPSLAERISVIHNGIDLTLFTDPDPTYWQRRPEVAGCRPLLGAVGCFYKNQMELIELLPDICREFPTVKLLLIGEDEQNKTPLVSKAAELGVSKAVVFVGNVPRTQMKDALAGVDLQVSAFRNEGFGLTVIEGLAVGTLFVGYRAGGYPEIVNSGENGMLVDNRAELVTAICAMLRERTKWEQLRSKTMQQVRTTFSLKQMVDGYLKFYTSSRG